MGFDTIEINLVSFYFQTSVSLRIEVDFAFPMSLSQQKEKQEQEKQPTTNQMITLGHLSLLHLYRCQINTSCPGGVKL